LDPANLLSEQGCKEWGEVQKPRRKSWEKFLQEVGSGFKISVMGPSRFSEYPQLFQIWKKRREKNDWGGSKRFCEKIAAI